MGDEIFSVYLTPADYSKLAYAKLDLPASPWKLLDAMDKVRLPEGDSLYLEITDYRDFEVLRSSLVCSATNLLELNDLAERLSRLNEVQRIAFEGLVRVDFQKQESITLKRLRDLAESVDCCHVVESVVSDGQLGRFYAENGFVPEVEGMSDAAFELLDFEKVGKMARMGECGVYVPSGISGLGGYVVQHSDLKSAPEITLNQPVEPAYLTKDGIRQVKSVFARRIYHADRMHIYQQKDTARQELQAQTRKAMVECIAQLKHGAADNPRLEQLTEELAERLLTVKGRKVYGYLPPRVKAIVDAIVEELAKDERVSAAYETWQTLYEQVCLDYDQRPPKRLPLSQQKEFRSVRNMVIQETLQWMAGRQRCADAQRTSATSVESISPENSAAATKVKVESTAPTVPAQPKSDRAASTAPEDPASSDDAASEGTTPPAAEDALAFSQWSDHPNQQKGSAPAGSEYRAPTVGETVVRMLHHMSRIFEDNSKIDQIHRGLQIDRKRRQELRRKRLAMGHKPDDHEEQTFR